MYAIISDAAHAYQGVIPPDCWHEPYMPREEFSHEIRPGVVFWGLEEASLLLGLMGLQPVKDVNENHGFRWVTPAEKDRLLREYWAIPERQVGTSVVLERCERVHES